MTDANGSPEPHTFVKAHRRERKLREATLILPTGRRIKRNVTFGPYEASPGSPANDGGPHETSPLLETESNKKQASAKPLQEFFSKGRQWRTHAWQFANSRVARGVLKCSLAYLLGSMATFIPEISAILGNSDGKHMVATVTVYFHPARSIGSMFEAMICALAAFIYAVFICFSSMGVSIFFGQGLKNIVLGHVVVLILFCGGGMGFIGWTKQRLSNPLVNVACSLTSLAIITVITKEGAVQAAAFSDQKVTQVMIMIVMGVTATTAVSFLIWPVSARRDLEQDLVHVTDSFGDLLAMITRCFLSGSDEELKSPDFKEAMGKYKKLYTSLTKNLKEAKNEHFILGTEREYHLQVKLVHCLQRLGQNIGGLRSAANTQFLLLHHAENEAKTQKQDSFFSPYISTGQLSPTESYTALTPLNETPPRSKPVSSAPSMNFTGAPLNSTVNILDDIFSGFITQLGPSMKSLAITIHKILDELPFSSDGRIAVDAHFKSSLRDAIDLYTKSREAALQTLYKSKILSKSRSPEIEAYFEEVAASCGYFSFSLLDFAHEMKDYLDLLDDLKLEVEERPAGRTWSWLKVWRYVPQFHQARRDLEQHGVIDQNELNEIPAEVPSPTTRKAVAKLRSQRSNRLETMRYRIWRSLGFFRRDDIKFAIKVGIGAALYALPSFIAETRPLYQHWRGEWGLLSYMLVCSMTLGASNTTGSARFFGTCLGAVCAIVAWITSQGNAYVMAFFGWLMMLWCAYIIVALGKGPMGRFIMLTYNLSALYAYSLSVKDTDKDDDEGGVNPIITEIALHRVVAVLSGVLWGMIITRLIWPITARQKFKDGLSLLWLRMGLIWKRDPLNQLLPPSMTTTEPQTSEMYMDLREEFELRSFLTRLDNLRGSASSEVDLRGPFQDEIYARVLECTGKMLDAFHAMNVMIMKHPGKGLDGEDAPSNDDHYHNDDHSDTHSPVNDNITNSHGLAKSFPTPNNRNPNLNSNTTTARISKGEAAILRYTTNERAQLGSRISHLYQVLASSMKLQYPLNEALPSADNARDRLLARLFQFRRREMEKAGATDEDFELLYAYALVTGQISTQIAGLGKEMEELFGTLNEESLRLE